MTCARAGTVCQPLPLKGSLCACIATHCVPQLRDETEVVQADMVEELARSVDSKLKVGVCRACACALLSQLCVRPRARPEPGTQRSRAPTCAPAEHTL